MLFRSESAQFECVMDAVKALRNMKAERNVAPSKKVRVYLLESPIKDKECVYLYRLAGVESVEFIQDKSGLSGLKTVSLFGSYGEMLVPLGDLIDIAEEIARLEQELAKAAAEIARSEQLLANQGFVAKAPAALVDKEKDKLAANRAKSDKLARQLEAMR